MKDPFSEIRNVNDVHAIMVFSDGGKIRFEEVFSSAPFEKPSKNNWEALAKALNGIKEADVLYGENRIYIRKVQPGYLLIVMGLRAPVAMVRMSCDVLSSSLTDRDLGKKGLKSFFGGLQTSTFYPLR